ncbi:MAG TPA: hypothetical protein PLI53_00465 [Geobacteraceae bacterium]|nr:hypothetical protein [Geobacteraceae bacterium]
MVEANYVLSTGRMAVFRILFVVVLLSCVAGCSMKPVGEGIYEGVQTRNRLLVPPPERLEKQDYSTFDAYDRQRGGILRRDSGGSDPVR